MLLLLVLILLVLILLVLILLVLISLALRELLVKRFSDFIVNLSSVESDILVSKEFGEIDKDCEDIDDEYEEILELEYAFDDDRDLWECVQSE